MLSSRWPRSPSHGKCSKRFCGSSRSYGRSHHQRQRETFDVMHSRATDRRSASECQGKWPDQTLDQALGLPEVLVAVSTSGLSCKRAGKTRTLMPVCDSSGESRTKTSTTVIRSIEASWGWVKGDAGRRYGKQIFKIRRISVRRGGPLNDGACDGNCGDLDLSERSSMRISHSLPT